MLGIGKTKPQLFFCLICGSPPPFTAARRKSAARQPRSTSWKKKIVLHQLSIFELELDMSFRKRNIGLSTGTDRAPGQNSAAPAQQAAQTPESNPGIRPSPDDGRPTTSTGAPSLDNLLAGHGGLPIGKTLLIEENGTTDFAGALLRYYAAEGVVQDQRVHVVGMPEQWGRSLPGLIGPAEAADDKQDKRKGERMKIAWRYERLGEFGTGVAGSRGMKLTIVWARFNCIDKHSVCCAFGGSESSTGREPG